MPRGPPNPRAPQASRGDRMGGGGSRGRGRGGGRGAGGFGAVTHGFTLAEEALNTERRQWAGSDQKLRHSKVNFVSGGTVDPLPEFNATAAALAGMTLDSPTAAMEADNEEQEEEPEIEVIVDTIEVEIEEDLTEQQAQPLPEVPLFVVDTHGSVPVETGIPPPRVRESSPTPSNSSEEVILFTGRNAQGKGKDKSVEPRRMAPSQPQTITDPIDVKIHAVKEMIKEKKELLHDMARLGSVDEFSSREVRDSMATNSYGQKLEEDKQVHRPRRTRGRGRGRRTNGRDKTEQEEEDALMADYLANIDSDGAEALFGNTSFNHHELGGEDIWIDECSETSEDLPQNSNAKSAALGEWDPSDIVDFEDLATSDGVMGEIEAIFAKRERTSGGQHLVVFQGQTFDEARWVHTNVLIDNGGASRIREFEAEEKLIAEFQAAIDAGSTDEDDEDEDVDYDEDDDADLRERAIDRMSDETIARLLAKQESLGMGSAELLLFDDAADADESGDFAGEISRWNTVKKKSPKNTRGSKRSVEFPAASALADAFDGFDVMDFDRPSLKKKPKGRKGKLEFDLSDSDLAATMQDAWTNDRLKKKQRKQEREELRAAGLLGSKDGRANLAQQYKEGIGFQDIKEEIRNFLIRGDSTLVFPPMDKGDRKLVHEIANHFRLKSKSAGDGNKRYPVLYRTKNTSRYVASTFDDIERKLSRRNFYAPNTSTKGGGGGKRAARGGGSNAGVTYQDGDIVGGSAPELSADNRGRAMLEKMGWSSGTALGALNNKGIMEPVVHVVKNSKAGLQ